jgi:hypothetical protein
MARDFAGRVVRIKAHFEASVVHRIECRVEDDLKLSRENPAAIWRVFSLAILSASILTGSSAI